MNTKKILNYIQNLLLFTNPNPLNTIKLSLVSSFSWLANRKLLKITDYRDSVLVLRLQHVLQ